MCLPNVGDYRVVLQQYKYGEHQVFCIFKIRADSVSVFERQPEQDFDWMTAVRWIKLESSLWKLFSSFGNWKQDSNALKTEMIIDHIRVSIQTTEKLLSAAQTLLPDAKSCPSDLCLEIVLKYMSHDEATILNAQATKRKQPDINKEKAKPKPVGSSTAPKLTSISKSIEKSPVPELQNKQDESSRSSRAGSGTLSRKRERRSISHDSHNVGKESQKNENRSRDSSIGSRASKRSKSPVSRASSIEPKPERRSARSPVKPSRFKEYQLGDSKTRKVKAKSATITEDSRKPIKGNVQTGKSKSSNANNNDSHKRGLFNEAHINVEALKQINEMLETPKPREVEILLLKDMDEPTVLGTFENYRVDFDRLFKEREHKFQTTSYMSIDHCHIMDILSNSIREKMIKKLGEVYSKKGPHCSLVINGLLPLWIIRLFMDKYKFTKEEAVRQIADQLKFHTYVKAINNDPLSSDLED